MQIIKKIIWQDYTNITKEKIQSIQIKTLIKIDQVKTIQ